MTQKKAVLSNDELIDKFSACLWDEGHHSNTSKQEFKEKLHCLISSSEIYNLKDIFIFLFENFKYYSLENVNKHLIDLYQKLEKDLKVDVNKCLYSYIKRSDGKINSSIDYARSFHGLNKIPRDLFTDDVIQVLQKYEENINDIILVDDCCGTGSTLKEFIENLAKTIDLSNKTIYYLVIHKMKDADSVLTELESMGTNLKIKCLAITQTDKVFNVPEVSMERDRFRNFSMQKGINESLIFGRDDSEAIFAFYNNTPNNTLGIFHAFSKGKNLPLFPRKNAATRKAPWELKEGKKRREGMRANKVFYK